MWDRNYYYSSHRSGPDRFSNDIKICAGTTQHGEPCLNAVLDESDYCRAHGGVESNPITDEMARKAAEMYHYDGSTLKQIASELGVKYDKIVRLKQNRFRMRRVNIDRRQVLARQTDLEYAGALIKVAPGEWHQIMAPDSMIEETPAGVRRLKDRY